VQHYLDSIHRCVIVVSEGTKYPDGSFLNETKGDFARDAFGHVQLGGAAQALQTIVQEDCRVKARIAMPVPYSAPAPILPASPTTRKPTVPDAGRFRPLWKESPTKWLPW
jgi:hypothetical protein